jgi:alginate O-acetyltransferase complex protein AlgI
MTFPTFEFSVFFLVILGLYYVLPHRAQNVMLLIASYIFYGWWDWRFLGLLFFSTSIDYLVGLGLVSARFERYRGALLAGSIVVQLGLLAFFKYFNFFAGSLAVLLRGLGVGIEPLALNILLPVGISFYTFHTMSYTIDIYRRELQPTRDFIAFALFISYFPQLVAGPIARAHHLLPQTLHPRKPSLAESYEGAYFILWGLFKKVVIADNLAVLVNRAFASPGSLDSLSAATATYAFTWQIYCDFSGYTDIARGCANLMGFHLQLNFNLPYFSSSPGAPHQDGDVQ